MHRSLLTPPHAEMHTKGKIRVVLNSVPGIIKNDQRWSASQHRCANLSLVLATDKPPFNQRLCVKNVFFSSPSLPSHPLGFSKQGGNVAVPSACEAFLVPFHSYGERQSGRGRPLSGGGGGGTRVHATATGERAGWYAAVRRLRQSVRVGQNLRPGGTSAGSCGKKPDKRAWWRELERRSGDTER